MQETPKWQRSGLTHGVLYMVIHFKRLACSGRRHRYSHHRSPIYRRYTSIMKCITGTTGRLVELIRYWQYQWTPTHCHDHAYYLFFIFYSVIVICYACLLMLLYFVMRIMIVTHDTHGIKLTPARCAEPWFGYSPNAEYVGEEHLGHPDQAGPSYQGQ